MLKRISALPIRSTLACALAVVALAVPGFSAQEKEGAGAVISGQATAKDVGLPIYPGSKPHKDKDDDSSAANLGLWGGGAGFKLVVLKMESGDSAEKIASFYKNALSKYGPVLDCSNPSAAPKSNGKDDSGKTLTCDDDKPEKGGYLFKAGTKDKHHVVAIQPDTRGSLYQLVSVGAWSKK
jgi:hypothetical protein